MRGTVAKALRRLYPVNEKKYSVIGTEKKMVESGKDVIKLTVINTGGRKNYQEAKKLYNMKG